MFILCWCRVIMVGSPPKTSDHQYNRQHWADCCLLFGYFAVDGIAYYLRCFVATDKSMVNNPAQAQLRDVWVQFQTTTVD